MKFLVRYLEAGAQSVSQRQIEAGSEAELRDELEAGACVVLSVQRSSAPLRAEPFNVGWWCRELRTLITAGMTVVEAIETIAANGPADEHRATVHGQLLDALRQGQSLSKAMRSVGAFPEVLVASVTASERTSSLGQTLDDYLRYDAVLERLRRQAVSAAIYPAVVVGLGAAISVFLLLVVIPRFSRMYVDSQVGLSVATQGVLWLSNVLKTHGGVLVALVAAMSLGFLLAWRNGLLMRMLAAALDGIGPLRRNWDQFRLAKLYQSLAMMFRGGYSLEEALAVCQGLQLGVQMAQSLEAAKLSISNGRSASGSFKDAGLTELVTYRLLLVGERSGGFDAVLQTIAERHAQSFETFLERATRVIEPLLLLVVALVVGGIVVMMYMPIFDMAGRLGSGA